MKGTEMKMAEDSIWQDGCYEMDVETLDRLHSFPLSD